MKALFRGKCDDCEQVKWYCATVAVRGCNVYGDRETRVQTLCHDCRKRRRGLYRLHPKHKAKGKS